jgi:hypothetical protein
MPLLLAMGVAMGVTMVVAVAVTMVWAFMSGIPRWVFTKREEEKKREQGLLPCCVLYVR